MLCLLSVQPIADHYYYCVFLFPSSQFLNFMMYCTLYINVQVHCANKILIRRIQTKPVTVAADATAYIWFLCLTYSVVSAHP